MQFMLQHNESSLSVIKVPMKSKVTYFAFSMKTFTKFTFTRYNDSKLVTQNGSKICNDIILHGTASQFV